MNRRGIVTALCGLALAGADARAEKGEGDGRVEVGGRVFYRLVGFEEGDGLRLDHDLASARLQVEWRWKRWLRVVGEAELDGRVRDAYVRVRKGGIGARAGQFKPPGSAIELESAWTLPTVGRGLMNDVLVGRMQIGGRRPGAQVEWSGEDRVPLRVTLGVFQPTSRTGDLIERSEASDLNVAGRAAWKLGPVELGAFGESFTTTPRRPGRYWAAGMDATLDETWCGQGVRAWGEVIVGSSGFTIDAADDRTTFFMTRAIGAWRRGGVRGGEAYVEPYALAAFLDPDSRFTDDQVGELAVGVNAGAWRRLRVTLELAITRVQDQPPALLDPNFDSTDPRLLVDDERVKLQVGAAF